MIVDNNFKFRVNISNDYYEKKTDATACLSQTGAKAIGKAKMAFRECDVTIEQFLWGAIHGYTFCNLFQFDPNKKYYLETCDGRHYPSKPLYEKGPNKGCMKLSFKRDQFFMQGILRGTLLKPHLILFSVIHNSPSSFFKQRVTGSGVPAETKGDGTRSCLKPQAAAPNKA